MKKATFLLAILAACALSTVSCVNSENTVQTDTVAVDTVVTDTVVVTDSSNFPTDTVAVDTLAK